MSGLGIRELLTPPRAPTANAYCERVVGTLRRDCLDHLLVWDDRQAERLLREYAMVEPSEDWCSVRLRERRNDRVFVATLDHSRDPRDHVYGRLRSPMRIILFSVMLVLALGRAAGAQQTAAPAKQDSARPTKVTREPNVL